MRFLRAFVVGLFTRHILTKFLALMLAMILFVTVRQQNERVWKLDELTVQFKLEDDLRDRFVLLRNAVPLRSLKVRGLPARVGSEAVRLQEDKVKRYTLTESFLDRFLTRRAITLDEALLEEILGEGMDVDPFPPVNVPFDRFKEARYEVIYPPEDEAKLQLADDVPYRAVGDEPRRLRIRFSCPITVTLRGPENAFTKDPGRLFVKLRDLNAALRKLRSDQEEFDARVPIDHVDWVRSGIDPLYLAHVEVDGVPAREFEESLAVLFRVGEVREATDLKLEIRIVNKPNGVQIGRWRISSGFTDSEYREGIATVRVYLPRALRQVPDLEKRLVLVLDFASAKTRPEKNELRVPVYLAVKPPVRAEDLKLLQRVELPADATEAIFLPQTG